MTMHRHTIAAITAITLGVMAGPPAMASMGSSGAAPFLAAGSGSSAEPTISGSMGEAAAEAAETGEAVEVADMTTETTSVAARPEGGFVLTSHRAPVRARTDRGWEPVNENLTVNSDGTLSPALTPVKMRFSGGGTAPLVTLATDEGQVSLTWPAPLPVPTIDANIATYAEVLPGVDLQMIATTEGYKQLITVKDAAAADNPALETLSLTARADGLRLAADADGALRATNDAGETVLAGPAPYQWDNSAGHNGDTPTTTETGSAKVDPITVTASPADGTDTPAHTTVKIQPNLAALRAADTQYPVRIDPVMSDVRNHYLTVQSNGSDYYDDTTEPMRVGECYGSTCNYDARSYFSFDVSPISDQPVTADISNAKVIATQVHNASCSATPVNLWSAGNFTSTTNWGGPATASLQQVSSKAGNAACSPANPDADIAFENANVDAYVQSWADADLNIINFALISPDENNPSYWKKFGVNPKIEVTYDFPPDPPTGLKLGQAVSCPNQRVITRDTTPALYAQADNNNPGATTIDLLYEVYEGSTSKVRWNTSPLSAAENQSVFWVSNSTNTNNAAALPNGYYNYHVQSQSAWQTAWSGWYSFTIDNAPPSTPTITSFDYPENTWGAPTNFKGSFKLAGSSDTASFAYAIDTPSGIPGLADTTCAYNNYAGAAGTVAATSGAATLTPGTTLAAGPHTLYVRAFDHAHNYSSTYDAYTFYVAPTHGTNTTLTSNPHLHEAENLPITLADSSAQSEYDESGGSYWSGLKQSHLVGDNPSAGPTFTYSLQAPKDGRYTLGFRYTTQHHYADYEVYINDPQRQGPPAATVAGYTPSGAFGYADLGDHRLLGPDASGNPRPTLVTVRFTGTNAAITAPYANPNGDTGYSAGIDHFTAALREAAAYPNLQAAFNNDGVSTPTNTTGNLQYTTTGSKTLSEAALDTAGLGAGDTHTFTSPSGRAATIVRPLPAGTKDNVVAMGQTIDIDDITTTTDTEAHLIVASSCATTPISTSNFATFKFITTEDLTDPDVALPAIPNWQDTPATAANLTPLPLGSYYNGTTETTATNHVYRLTLPLQNDYANQTLTAITLPNTHNYTTPTTTCDPSRPSLHVLALSIQQ